jgi:hypothetical protein
VGDVGGVDDLGAEAADRVERLVNSRSTRSLKPASFLATPILASRSPSGSIDAA